MALFLLSFNHKLQDALLLATNQLLQNPSDFADAMRSFYGNQKANQFKDLLTQHLPIAAALVNAAKQETHTRWILPAKIGMQMQMPLLGF